MLTKVQPYRSANWRWLQACKAKGLELNSMQLMVKNSALHYLAGQLQFIYNLDNIS